LQGLVLCALGWLAGVMLQLHQADLWPLPGLAAGALGGIVTGALALRQVGRSRWVLAACACLAFGLVSTSWRAEWRLAGQLPAALEGQDLQVVGVVASLPQVSATGTRFELEVESARQGQTPIQLPQRLALGWYHDADAGSEVEPPWTAPVRAGERWRLTVRLRQPHGSLNPHGFDYELWLFERGLRATGYVRDQPANPAARLDADAGFAVERLRQRLRDRIQSAVPDPHAAGVLAALAIGDQGAISRADWDVFRITGVAHLMSISGLHVTMFAWLAQGLVGGLWRRSRRLMLGLPAPAAARWGGLALAFAYAVVAGWGVPAQRTVLMIAVVVVVRSLGLLWPQSLVLLLAAVGVTLLDPWALLQPGFWLSFVAVGLLITSDPVRGVERVEAPTWPGRVLSTLRAGLRTQWLATIGLAPLSLVFFQQLSLVGFFANLVSIPVVTLLITPLSLLGIWIPGLWAVAAAGVQVLSQGLAMLAGLPWAQWTTPAAPAWAALAGLAGGALLVMPLPWRLRALGLPCLLPLLLPPVPVPDVGRFEAVALDVGQGTAVLVRTHAHLLVYDTGPLYSAESDAGQRVLLPVLQARGERRVDLLMLSHRDSDHVGGARSLLAQLPVTAISSSLGSTHPIRRHRAPHRPCLAGDRWSWDGVQFEVLHPDADTYQASTRPNALSCVLRVSGGQGSLLLSGDIERAQELNLVDRLGPRLRSDVLLVPHHGSKTSSTTNFLAAVAPRVAVVQAGYRSRFGHPAPTILARYGALGTTVYRSDRCGAWIWRADGGMQCQREVAARYWHHRVGEGRPTP
jgi:competence protein ComEC